MKILALTVGGSCAPLVTAIREYQPDRVCFFATAGPRGSRITVDGPGSPCRQATGEEHPSIVIQTGLSPDRYEVVELEDPDDLPALFEVCMAKLRDLRQKYPDAQCIADYTGGSKSMSLALALAALECGWELSLVRGQRPDLVKVADGTELAGLVNIAQVRAHQQMEEARRLFNAYAYTSAQAILESIVRSAPLPRKLEQRIQTWVVLCRGFDAWDRFDHQRAFQILQTVQSHVVPQWRFLKRLVGQDRPSGYEPVLDLIRNAERRAAQGRYDDAVARLYRALELLAQIRLRIVHQIDTGDVKPELLPLEIRPRYENRQKMQAALGRDRTLKLGLWEAYELLVDLDDPVGQVIKEQEGPLRDVLSRRNQSILAHGTSPIREEEYRRIHEIVVGLIEAGLKAINVQVEAPQFPELPS
ncbi:MAG TPA: TIGR02710 family CRISPR-associated CARF protein [Thermoflexus sp.]|nr:TIGR02710 family CRISPR-associated CARF protein [Thermoflexus sp.]